MIPSGLILTEDRLREAVEYFLTKEAFAFDVEAYGETRGQSQRAPLSWISLATYGCCIVIPMGHPLGSRQIGTTKVPTEYKTGNKAGQFYNKTVPVWDDPPEQLERAQVFDILRPLFFSDKIKIGHDVIYDITAVSNQYDEIIPPPYSCTKVAAWLGNENNRRSTWLKEMIEDVYELKYDYEGIGACVESFPFDMVAYYSFCDSKMDWLLWKKLMVALAEEGLTKVFNMEMNVLNVLIDMKMQGATIDRSETEKAKVRLEELLTEAEMDVRRLANDKTFNLNSPRQVGQKLFLPKSKGGQGIKPYKLTKRGKEAKEQGLPIVLDMYSTDKSALESFTGNLLVEALLRHSQIETLLSSFINPWLGTEDSPSLIVPGTSTIHAGFQQYGTVTGRFSCRKPNMQNIPRVKGLKDDPLQLGMMIKSLFVAEEGYELVVADYSQIELVVLAHYIGYGPLFDVFQNGDDPHRMTAAMVLGKPENEITKDQRQDLGKTLGFATVYGAGPEKVGSLSKTDTETGKQLLKKHAEMFPEIHSYRDNLIYLARQREPVPYITTLGGRKRRIPELNSRTPKWRMRAERQVFNSLIQGGAADIIKQAMVYVDNMLPAGAHVTLTVHDEIVVACPKHLVPEVEAALLEAMTGERIMKWFKLKVPLKVEIGHGTKWSECK